MLPVVFFQFNDLEDIDIIDFMDDMSRITEYYNERMGWNLAGWYKPSYEVDKGKTVPPTLHLCYVYPVSHCPGMFVSKIIFYQNNVFS